MGRKHADALVHGLQAMNVVDTSTTYLAGESETMIGEVLSSQAMKNRRKELVVVTKVGYLQGPLLADAARLEAENRLWPEVCMCPSVKSLNSGAD